MGSVPAIGEFWPTREGTFVEVFCLTHGIRFEYPEAIYPALNTGDRRPAHYLKGIRTYE